MNWNDLPQDVKEGLISDFTNIVTRVTTNTTSSIKLNIINLHTFNYLFVKLYLYFALFGGGDDSFGYTINGGKI